MKQTIFVLILLFTSNISLAQGEPSASDKWMFFYYQNPQSDKLVENVRAMSKRGQLAQTTGLIPAFLSRVFAQNPGKIDQWMTSLKDLPQNELYTLTMRSGSQVPMKGGPFSKKPGWKCRAALRLTCWLVR
jgi:hypothetical protein